MVWGVTPLPLPTSKRWSNHPARSLRSTTSAGSLVPPSLRANKGRSAKSQLFSVLGLQWWNELPADVRIAKSLTSFRKRLKTHLFRVHLGCVPISILPWVHLNIVHYTHSLSALSLRCQCRSKSNPPRCTDRIWRSRLPLRLLLHNKHPALNVELFTYSSYKKL